MVQGILLFHIPYLMSAVSTLFLLCYVATEWSVRWERFRAQLVCISQTYRTLRSVQTGWML